MSPARKGLLENILDIIAKSENPDQSIDAVVTAIKKAFHVDVCSVYALVEDGTKLVLRATDGLNQTAVGTISMKRNEGLTGLVLETLAPVFAVNPATHPRYKYYQDSGEEIYKTFLGLPLVYHQKVLGVLVVQTIDAATITKKDIPFFTKLATQIASTMAYTGILADLKKQQPSLPRHPDESGRKTMPTNFLKGVSAGSGFAKGHAFFYKGGMGFDQIADKSVSDISHEIKRFKRALEKSEADIRQIMKKTAEFSGEESAIIEAHLMYLNDRSFQSKIIARIENGSCAEFALKQEVLAYVRLFEQLEDPYLRDRGADIEDIGKRILGHLLGGGGIASQIFGKDTILFAKDLSPVDLININQSRLKGIVLAKGGITSHTVILAKSFEIPIIIGVKGLLQVITANDAVIMDAASGIVFKNPPEEIKQEYDRMAAEQSDQFKILNTLKDKPAVTLDGYHVHLGANIGLLSDLAGVTKYGADFIGLYRTEFPVLIRKSFPSEAEQFELYKKIIEKADGKTVTIRTMDLGGDKLVSAFDYDAEANPFLGWRSVRFSLDTPDIFRSQIRAILQASHYGPARMLFPMITAMDELVRINTIITEEKAHLREKGMSFDETIQTGIMVEVPAAVRILDKLLAHADFVSVGTNDLVQYMLAVDRNNEKVAHLYHPLHPAVIASVRDIITTCRRHEKPVCICGEAATNLNCVALFVAMGADSLSMNAISLPMVKHFIRRLDTVDLADVLENSLNMDTATEIDRFLSRTLDDKKDVQGDI